MRLRISRSLFQDEKDRKQNRHKRALFCKKSSGSALLPLPALPLGVWQCLTSPFTSVTAWCIPLCGMAAIRTYASRLAASQLSTGSLSCSDYSASYVSAVRSPGHSRSASKLSSIRHLAESIRVGYPGGEPLGYLPLLVH